MCCVYTVQILFGHVTSSKIDPNPKTYYSDSLSNNHNVSP